jgi:hypothetical protein
MAWTPQQAKGAMHASNVPLDDDETFKRKPKSNKSKLAKITRARLPGKAHGERADGNE